MLGMIVSSERTLESSETNFLPLWLDLIDLDDFIDLVDLIDLVDFNSLVDFEVFHLLGLRSAIIIFLVDTSWQGSSSILLMVSVNFTSILFFKIVFLCLNLDVLGNLVWPDPSTWLEIVTLFLFLRIDPLPLLSPVFPSSFYLITVRVEKFSSWIRVRREDRLDMIEFILPDTFRIDCGFRMLDRNINPPDLLMLVLFLLLNLLVFWLNPCCEEESIVLLEMGSQNCSEDVNPLETLRGVSLFQNFRGSILMSPLFRAFRVLRSLLLAYLILDGSSG